MCKTMRSSDYLHGLEEHDLMKNTRRIIKDRFRNDGRDSSWKTRIANVEFICRSTNRTSFLREENSREWFTFLQRSSSVRYALFSHLSTIPYDRSWIFFVQFTLVCYGGIDKFSNIRNSIDRKMRCGHQMLSKTRKSCVSSIEDQWEQ